MQARRGRRAWHALLQPLASGPREHDVLPHRRWQELPPHPGERRSGRPPESTPEQRLPPTCPGRSDHASHRRHELRGRQPDARLPELGHRHGRGDLVDVQRLRPAASGVDGSRVRAGARANPQRSTASFTEAQDVRRRGGPDRAGPARRAGAPRRELPGDRAPGGSPDLFSLDSKAAANIQTNHISHDPASGTSSPRCRPPSTARPRRRRSRARPTRSAGER